MEIEQALADGALLQPPEGIMARKSAAKKKKLYKAKPTWVCVGIDMSLSSIAGCAFMSDGILDKMRGPAIYSNRWERGTHYFDRMKYASKPEIFLRSLVSGLRGAVAECDQIFIAIEEPWPMGYAKQGNSAWLKQQAQLQGAFVGGLLRYGYTNIYEINSESWKKLVAADIGFKGRRTKEFKWNVKEWAIHDWGLPELPDLIQSKDGLKPKPVTSRAKPAQPEDVYDACGCMNWMLNEIGES
jgi:hypothetical protein